MSDELPGAEIKRSQVRFPQLICLGFYTLSFLIGSGLVESFGHGKFMPTSASCLHNFQVSEITSSAAPSNIIR